MATLRRIEIHGYKSIRELRLELTRINVLVGANGSGKSNFLSFFSLLHAVAAGRLAFAAEKAGGAHALLHYGPKLTARIAGLTVFETTGGDREHRFGLALGAGDRLIYEGEQFVRPHPEGGPGREINVAIGGGFERAESEGPSADTSIAAEIRLLAEQFELYHFHDTSINSPARLTAKVEENLRLRADAGNLAAVLYRYQQTRPTAYRRVVGTIRQIAPAFDDFVLAPRELNPDTILLNWRERPSEYLFGPYQLSDGTLRAIALVALLSQPKEDLPGVLLLDEPELGLHPAALNLVTGLLKAASHHCQVIVATQSAALVDAFDPEDIIVVDREDRQSTFHRLERAALQEWLQEYTLGQLWEKNVFGGGPFV